VTVTEAAICQPDDEQERERREREEKPAYSFRHDLFNVWIPWPGT